MWRSRRSSSFRNVLDELMRGVPQYRTSTSAVTNAPGSSGPPRARAQERKRELGLTSR